MSVSSIRAEIEKLKKSQAITHACSSCGPVDSDTSPDTPGATNHAVASRIIAVAEGDPVPAAVAACPRCGRSEIVTVIVERVVPAGRASTPLVADEDGNTLPEGI